MIVTAGAAKGLKLTVPKGHDVRPTGARVREALFNKLINQIDGCHWLDLFAGAGTMACEALSRGASKTVCVDLSSQAMKACQVNCLAVGERVTLTTGNRPTCEFYLQAAEVAIARMIQKKDRFDLIFCDPPYDLCRAWLQKNLVLADRLLGSEGCLIIEASKRTDLNFATAHFSSVQTKKYGETVLYFLS